MKRINYLLAILICATFYATTCGQVTVDVNLNVKHTVGGEFEFDRSKYLMLHAAITDGEWPSTDMQLDFHETYDVYLGRNNGALPWYIRTVGEDPAKPGWPDVSAIIAKGAEIRSNYAAKTAQHALEERSFMMYGGQNLNFPTGNSLPMCCGITPWTIANNAAAAEFYAQYIKEAFGNGGASGEPTPTYLEVINEPFVKANDLNSTRAEISEFHSVVAQRVKEVNPGVKVVGYTAAHPEYEANNFAHWDGNWKTFIDIAGADMDYFSFHIYDGETKDASKTPYYRAGSNTEALFDMLETYSVFRLGEVKPFVISEYGFLTHNYDEEAYTKERDWFNIRSFSTIMMQLMEKADLIERSMPFMILKANWWAPPATAPNARYPIRLLRQRKELEGETGEEWVYTEFIKFFDLWKDVKGTRIDTKATDIDIQADAYIDEKTMYLILNNLEHSAQTIKLNIVDTEANPVLSINVKHLLAVDDLPTLEETSYEDPVNEIEIGREATMILEYTFENEVLIDENSFEKKHYANDYLQTINAGIPINFRFDDINTKLEFGEVVLRLGIGRDHPAGGADMKLPGIKFNGVDVAVPVDWRGYDQKTRSRFFGILEIPIPYDLLKANDDNTLSVEFPDSGGHVSTAVLQKFDFSTKLDRSVGTQEKIIAKRNSWEVYPNPADNELLIKGLDQKNTLVEIYTIAGQKLIECQVSSFSNSIDVSHLQTGNFILKIHTGKEVLSTKFFKK